MLHVYMFASTSLVVLRIQFLYQDQIHLIGIMHKTQENHQDPGLNESGVMNLRSISLCICSFALCFCYIDV